MFGMKFRDRELPAPPLDNNPQSSMQSAKKTSMETTRKTLLETTTSKSSLETVKKVEVGSPQMSPHFLRTNGSLPSCLEVRFKQDCFFQSFRCIVYLFQGVWGALVQTSGQENCGRDGQKRYLIPFLCKHTLTFSSLAVGENGCFLVRDSRHGGVDSPLTLTLFNNDKVFNISIRLRPDGKVKKKARCLLLFGNQHMFQVALGKEKPDELGYTSVVAMVAHHKVLKLFQQWLPTMIVAHHRVSRLFQKYSVLINLIVFVLPQIESLTLTAGSSQQEHSKTRLTKWPPG